MRSLYTLFFIFNISLLFAQDKVYFSNQDQNTVERSDLDGGNLETIADGQFTLRRIRVDQKNERVYWVEANSGTLWRSELDGGNKTAFLSISSDLAVIEIDTLNERILFTESGDNLIQSVDLNGANIQTVVDGSGLVLGMDYDTVNDIIYWTDYNSGLIRKANGDGSNISTVIEVSEPFDLVVDPANNLIYFTNRLTNSVGKMTTTGTNLSTITPASSVAIGAISLDAVNEKIYWIEGEPYTVKSANLDGSEILVIATSTTSYAGLDVAPTPPVIMSSTPIQANTFSLNLFPNPNTEYLNFNLNNNLRGTLNVNLYNTEGILLKKETLQKEVNDFTHKMDVQAYPSGIYFLQIQIGGSTTTERFIHYYKTPRA